MSDAAGTTTAGRTERQHAIAALITETLIANGIDYGGAGSDVVSIHSATIGYQIIDSLRDAGLAITRRRGAGTTAYRQVPVRSDP